MKRRNFKTCLPEPKAAFVDHLIEITPGKHFSSPSGKPAVPVVSSKAKKTQQTNKPNQEKALYKYPVCTSHSNMLFPLCLILVFSKYYFITLFISSQKCWGTG